ncbi:MAG: hypothetical protein ACRDNF_04030 [Streptosporangiaceae bacterium]
MRYRVTFVAGLAAGFVMGTRAGRERYEQMKKVARRAADNPAVQQAAGAAAAQAAGLAKSAKEKVTGKVQERTSGLAGVARQKAGQLQTRVPGRRTGSPGTQDLDADAASVSLHNGLHS